LIIDGQLKAVDTPQNLKLKYGQRKVQVQVEGQKEIMEYELEQLGKNQDFLAILAKHNIRTIHSKEASLEEVFIQITGESLI
jgi:fluoroquinolone transport system ATP-binding protein